MGLKEKHYRSKIYHIFPQFWGRQATLLEITNFMRHITAY